MNLLNACEARGCHRGVDRSRGRYCRLHYVRLSRTGDALGRIISRRDLKPHREFARELLIKYRDRPAVKAALTWADRLLNSYNGTPVTVEMERLRTKGCTPAEIIETVVAVVSFQRSDTRFDDGAVLTYNLAHAVCRLRPRPTRYTRRGKGGSHLPVCLKRPLGMLLRETLLSFAVQMLKAYEDGEREQAALKKTIKNFNTPEEAQP